MYYEAQYSVEAITRTSDGDERFEAKKHGRRTHSGRNYIKNLPIPESVDLEIGDVVRLQVENHSLRSGTSSRSWALERFCGFPYEKERGWAPLEGLE